MFSFRLERNIIVLKFLESGGDTAGVAVLRLAFLVLSLLAGVPAMAEDVTLRVALWDYSNTEYYKTMINGFKEANPGIDV